MNTIHLPPDLVRDLDAALAREWLVTSGAGGFAAGTVAGALTRRYHGLLIAALEPPAVRRYLVAKLDTTVVQRTGPAPLYTNIWGSGVEQPAATAHLHRFDLVWGVPTWQFVIGDVRLTQRIWMEPGRDVTYVEYELADTAPPTTLAARLLVNDRNYHLLGAAGDRKFRVKTRGAEIEIRGPETTLPVRVLCTARGAHWAREQTWCRGFELPVETARGFEHVEDHLSAGLCTFKLQPGTAALFRIGLATTERPRLPQARARREAQAADVLDTWAAAHHTTVAQTPIPLRQLVLAADQFVVARPTPQAPAGHTLIAGYPWFTDWGRDTMIALPGLTLTTGRADVARQILRTWAEFLCDGLIPNRFPDAGGQPEYHTADASLWYLWAIDQYVRATHDTATLAALYPVMCAIVAAYRRGTRHDIRVGDDGLVSAGQPGSNLTWMDARVANQPVTSRAGKPVELSALWYDALCNLARLADLLDESGDEYVRLAARTRNSFQRFWNVHTRCCYDVLDGPQGHEGLVRPNQILAVSLSHCPLTVDQQQAVVQTCHQRLQTWFGLRSLAPGEPGYRGLYRGNPAERDTAYHQGTAWGWLLPHYVLAQYKLHHDRAEARHLLEPLLCQLWSSGLGTLSEIFDGEYPHRADGCFAQAWTVAEVLRAWCITQSK